MNTIDSVIEKRLAKLTGVMASNNVDYLILGPSPDMYYFTGIKTVPDERLQLLIIDKKGDVDLILPEMYRSLVAETDFSSNLSCWGDENDPRSLVKEHLETDQNSILAIDNRLRFLHFHMIKDLFSARELIPSGRITGEVRICKDEREITMLRNAAGIADRVMNEMADFIKPGLTENEIANEIEYKLKKYGGEGLSFNPIVASGKNGALPHHNTGHRQVENGDFITMDFGCVVNGYCSDMTRTYALGEAEEKMTEVYNVVKYAQLEAVAAVKAGVKCSEIDRVARDIIKDAGYGKYFTHRIGHGIGLEIHEDPFIVAGNDLILKEGMAFSIEPGIYLPDKFGVRIEDIVVVTEDSCIVLNSVTKELKII